MLVMMIVMLMMSRVTMLKLELVFFQVEREDVILDCDLDIVINNDGDVDGVVSFTVKVQQMELMMKAVVTE